METLYCRCDRSTFINLDHTKNQVIGPSGHCCHLDFPLLLKSIECCNPGSFILQTVTEQLWTCLLFFWDFWNYWVHAVTPSQVTTPCTPPWAPYFHLTSHLLPWPRSVCKSILRVSQFHNNKDHILTTLSGELHELTLWGLHKQDSEIYQTCLNSVGFKKNINTSQR